MAFQQFKFLPTLERALTAMKFEEPTPIQVKAIPIALQGKDLIATAQTGTGKTAAFSLPTATFLLGAPGMNALVLAPTRELAQQIEMTWKALTRFAPELRSTCIIGGASFSMQSKQISRGPRLVIATPGRLCDHLNRRTIHLSKVGVLILDEADRMLDMGFAPQLNEILRHLPKSRQTLLFSATWEPKLSELAKKYLRDPVRIAVGETSQAAGTIEQTALTTTVHQKNDVLLDELNRRKGSVLIFTRTQNRTDRLARFLNSYGLQVGRLHGGRTQAQRTTALSTFRSGQLRILVATDIASRGIDVTDIAHVINYDLPRGAEDYIHRIGRTGRAGLKGESLSLITPEDRSQWNDILKLLKKTGSAQPIVQAAGTSSYKGPQPPSTSHLPKPPAVVATAVVVKAKVPLQNQISARSPIKPKHPRQEHARGGHKSNRRPPHRPANNQRTVDTRIKNSV